MAKKVLLTGAAGQFGRDFIRIYGKNFHIVALRSSDCDIRELDQLVSITRETKPDCIIHAAAWTSVDGAETNPDAAFSINAIGSRNVAIAADIVGAYLIALSTDYVFGANKQRHPYTEFDTPAPINLYGKSKLAGEEMIKNFNSRYCIVRTAWLYGREGKNFPRSIIEKAIEKSVNGDVIKVVADQKGTPTSTQALADLVFLLIQEPVYGIVHGSCEGEATWYEFAHEILNYLEIPCYIESCTSQELKRPAPRPAYSVLDKMVLRLEGRTPMPHWKDALRQWLEENKDDFA